MPQTVTFPHYLWVFFSNKPIRQANASWLYNYRNLFKGHNIWQLPQSFQETRNTPGIIRNSLIATQRALNVLMSKLQNSCNSVMWLALTSADYRGWRAQCRRMIWVGMSVMIPWNYSITSVLHLLLLTLKNTFQKAEVVIQSTESTLRL